MPLRYNLENIHQLLSEGFTEEDFCEGLCAFEKQFLPFFNNHTYGQSPIDISQLINYAIETANCSFAYLR
jgi:hypothetical protein